MRRVSLFVVVLAITAAAAAAQTPPRISRIEFTPAAEDQGGGVVIALLGTGDCTYTIDYGDGKHEKRTATLPDRIHHAYAPDNEYMVVATPEAPCEGTARAKLDVRAITRGIWRVTVEPGPSTDAPEIIATIDGRGACVVMVEFGDGKSQKVEATLPARVTHVYEKAGQYELHAAAADPCRGDVRLTLDVRR